MKKIGKEQVRKARQTLAKYKEGKAVLDKNRVKRAVVEIKTLGRNRL